MFIEPNQPLWKKGYTNIRKYKLNNHSFKLLHTQTFSYSHGVVESQIEMTLKMLLK
jgi:hypothetical protein